MLGRGALPFAKQVCFREGEPVKVLSRYRWLSAAQGGLLALCSLSYACGDSTATDEPRSPEVGGQDDDDNGGPSVRGELDAGQAAGARPGADAGVVRPGSDRADASNRAGEGPASDAGK